MTNPYLELKAVAEASPKFRMYKDDLYKWDREILAERPDHWPFGWMLKDGTGTQLFFPEHLKDAITAVTTWSTQVSGWELYWWDGHTLAKVDTARDMIALLQVSVKECSYENVA